MRPEAHRIKTEALPKFDGTIPHIKRTFMRPPGMETPEIVDRYGLYREDEVPQMIESSLSLSKGTKLLLTGLLKSGGVAKFGNEAGFDLGINYNEIYKDTYKGGVMKEALREIAEVTEEHARLEGYSVDAVLAPELSGIKQATVYSSFLKDADCVSVKKNGHNKSPMSVAVDSYTQGKTDIISLAQSALEDMKREGRKNVVLSDDIIDSGVMTQAVALLIQLAQEQGYDIHLVGVVSPIEKLYTGAREKIQKELGRGVPIFSALQIEDIGLLSDSQAWIKVETKTGRGFAWATAQSEFEVALQPEELEPHKEPSMRLFLATSAFSASYSAHDHREVFYDAFTRLFAFKHPQDELVTDNAHPKKKMIQKRLV